MNTRMLLTLFVLGLGLLANGCSAQQPVLVAIQPTVANPTLLPTATYTPMPPTATNTGIPPTALPTQAPATATPTLTPTPIPPTNTATATNTNVPLATEPPTNVPPTAPTKPTQVPATQAPPQAANAFTVAWKTDMGYEPRNDNQRWCKMHNETQNLTAEDMLFQDPETFKKVPAGLMAGVQSDGFQPIFVIANPDGTVNHWSTAGWYAKIFGWQNGIEDFPPKPVVGGASSGDWTWYSVAQNNGEYCRFVYVRWKGQTLAAEYAPDGKLISSNATLPPGAP